MSEILTAPHEVRKCEICGSNSWRVLHEGDESNCECVGECLRVCDNPELLDGCDGVAYLISQADGLTAYAYNVEIIGLYWVLTTRVEIELPDTVGNCSDEARELVETTADDNLRGELGISPLGFAHSCIITLLLDGEEVQI